MVAVFINEIAAVVVVQFFRIGVIGVAEIAAGRRGHPEAAVRRADRDAKSSGRAFRETCAG